MAVGPPFWLWRLCLHALERKSFEEHSALSLPNSDLPLYSLVSVKWGLTHQPVNQQEHIIISSGTKPKACFLVLPFSYL